MEATTYSELEAKGDFTTELTPISLATCFFCHQEYPSTMEHRQWQDETDNPSVCGQDCATRLGELPEDQLNARVLEACELSGQRRRATGYYVTYKWSCEPYDKQTRLTKDRMQIDHDLLCQALTDAAKELDIQGDITEVEGMVRQHDGLFIPHRPTPGTVAMLDISEDWEVLTYPEMVRIASDRIMLGIATGTIRGPSEGEAETNQAKA